MAVTAWQSAALNGVARYDRKCREHHCRDGGHYLDLAEEGGAYVEGAVSMTRSTISDNTTL
ncbi:MAG TPA: hypothetical protein VHE32_05545 [Rhodanobacteraceae bacterium]|nr:hypothetical protein [Rhodanobacteraceae bacterium]